jgi:hypothetical protein
MIWRWPDVGAQTQWKFHLARDFHQRTPRTCLVRRTSVPTAAVNQSGTLIVAQVYS